MPATEEGTVPEVQAAHARFVLGKRQHLIEGVVGVALGPPVGTGGVLQARPRVVAPLADEVLRAGLGFDRRVFPLSVLLKEICISFPEIHK